MRPMILGLAAGSFLVAGAAMAQDRGGDMMRGGDMTRGGGMRGEFRGDMRDGMRGGMRDGMDGRGGGMMGRFSPEDIEAFADARLAALHAGLKLSPDQERMWPPVEEAIRGLTKLRREQFRAWRESRDQPREDLPALLRTMADRQGARAEALRRLADAAAPLYATFDEGQKRRLRLLARHLRPRGGMMRQAWRGMDRDRPGMER
jgi:zinc resistance-associated protein